MIFPERRIRVDKLDTGTLFVHHLKRVQAPESLQSYLSLPLVHGSDLWILRWKIYARVNLIFVFDNLEGVGSFAAVS